MADPKLYSIIGGGVIVLLVVSGFMIFLSYGMEEYDVINYNGSDLEFLQNSSSNFQNIAPAFDNATGGGLDPDDPDKQGTLLSRAQSALSTSKNSITFFTQISTKLTDMLGLGEFGDTVTDVLIGLVVIVLVLGIALAAIFGLRL